MKSAIAPRMRFAIVTALAAALCSSPLPAASSRCGGHVASNIPHRVPHGFWTDDKVLLAITHLYQHRNQISLRQSAMSTDESQQTSELLQQCLGIAVEGKKLYYEAKRRFGSWKAAIEAAGFDYWDYVGEDDGNLLGFWSKQKVQTAIRHLYDHRQQVNLLSEAMSIDSSAKTASLLEEIFGKRVTGSKLHSAARRYFGNWKKAFESCGRGFRYDKLQDYYQVIFFTPARIVALIQNLNRVGIGVSATAIQHDDSYRTSSMILIFGGRWSTGQTLYIMACKRFGSWSKALAAAKLDPNEHRERVAWTREMIIDTLKALHAKKVPLNIQSLLSDTSERTLSILKLYSGKAITTSALFGAAYRKFGSWDAALEGAGLDPSMIRVHLSRRHRAVPPHQQEPYDAIRSRTDVIPLHNLIGNPEQSPLDALIDMEFRDRIRKLVATIDPQSELPFDALIEIVLTSDVGIQPSNLAEMVSAAVGQSISTRCVNSMLEKLKALAI